MDYKILSKLSFIKERDYHEGHIGLTASVSDIKNYIKNKNIHVCEICKKVLKFLDYEINDKDMFSIDRIDISKAHSIDNIRIVCLECNYSHKGATTGKKDRTKNIKYKEEAMMDTKLCDLYDTDCAGCYKYIRKDAFILADDHDPPECGYEIEWEHYGRVVRYPNVSYGLCIGCSSMWCAECILYANKTSKGISKCMKYHINYSGEGIVVCPECVDDKYLLKQEGFSRVDNYN